MVLFDFSLVGWANQECRNWTLFDISVFESSCSTGSVESGVWLERRLGGCLSIVRSEGGGTFAWYSRWQDGHKSPQKLFVDGSGGAPRMRTLYCSLKRSRAALGFTYTVITVPHG